jgi:TusA-related sulfurtransferase
MTEEIRDFTEMTCTNLMIKLRVLLKKLPSGQKLTVIITREQHDNIREPFSKKQYRYSAEKIGDNRFQADIVKVE